MRLWYDSLASDTDRILEETGSLFGSGSLRTIADSHRRGAVCRRHGSHVGTLPKQKAYSNWAAASSERWTLPIGGGVGKIVKLGKQPINLQLQAFDNVVTPQGGADWQLRFQMSFLFPK
jgi:hypothetical protein